MLKCPILAAWVVYWLCLGHTVKCGVVCDESKMTVGFERSKQPRFSVNNLRLNDPTGTNCNIRSNSTHIYAVFPLNSCGTTIEENDENLIFKNEFTTLDSTGIVITRKCLLELKFSCQYPKRGNVSQNYSVYKKKVVVTEKGYGTFTYQFEFYPNNKFPNPFKPSSYPLECNIGTKVFMQIEATSSFSNAELFVESCRAAPSDSKSSRPTYSIIENGCDVDGTLEIYTPTHERQFRFSMEAFKFIGLFDQVYISCSVLMCKAKSPGTRCSQGCIKSGSIFGRRKREAATQSKRHFISQGPLRLKRSAESAGSPAISLNLNLNLVFIAGCLLAAVGMISAVVLYKARTSRVKYLQLHANES